LQHSLWVKNLTVNFLALDGFSFTAIGEVGGFDRGDRNGEWETCTELVLSVVEGRSRSMGNGEYFLQVRRWGWVWKYLLDAWRSFLVEWVDGY
ncbi:MAG: hypothetical protein V7L09_04395, partial [Nostoc sp.]|uniref:hypothetical protein n=1 Tax=Nostoc sp. TaxID=1180 RepID=UPI002FF08839